MQSESWSMRTDAVISSTDDGDPRVTRPNNLPALIASVYLHKTKRDIYAA